MRTSVPTSATRAAHCGLITATFASMLLAVGCGQTSVTGSSTEAAVTGPITVSTGSILSFFDTFTSNGKALSRQAAFEMAGQQKFSDLYDSMLATFADGDLKGSINGLNLTATRHQLEDQRASLLALGDKFSTLGDYWTRNGESPGAITEAQLNSALHAIANPPKVPGASLGLFDLGGTWDSVKSAANSLKTEATNCYDNQILNQDIGAAAGLGQSLQLGGQLLPNVTRTIEHPQLPGTMVNIASESKIAKHAGQLGTILYFGGIAAQGAETAWQKYYACRTQTYATADDIDQANALQQQQLQQQQLQQQQQQAQAAAAALL